MFRLQTRENVRCYLKDAHKIEESHQYVKNFEHENILWE